MTTAEYKKPLPRPDELSQPFWDAAKRHELLVQRCRHCDEKHSPPPQDRCRNCLSTDLEWVKVSGRGRVYTYTIVRQPGNPAFNDDVPYVFAVVQLDEGPRLNTNIVGIDIDKVEVDMPVEVAFEDVTPEISLPKFKPAS